MIDGLDNSCKIALTWWRHQMETFSALLALCAGNSTVPVNSPYKGQWRGALMFSLIYAWINDWVNSREAGDLRHQRDHYDVIVMDECHCWNLRMISKHWFIIWAKVDPDLCRHMTSPDHTELPGNNRSTQTEVIHSHTNQIWVYSCNLKQYFYYKPVCIENISQLSWFQMILPSSL